MRVVECIPSDVARRVVPSALRGFDQTRREGEPSSGASAVLPAPPRQLFGIYSRVIQGCFGVGPSNKGPRLDARQRNTRERESRIFQIVRKPKSQYELTSFKQHRLLALGKISRSSRLPRENFRAFTERRGILWSRCIISSHGASSTVSHHPARVVGRFRSPAPRVSAVAIMKAANASHAIFYTIIHDTRDIIKLSSRAQRLRTLYARVETHLAGYKMVLRVQARSFASAQPCYIRTITDLRCLNYLRLLLFLSPMPLLLLYPRFTLSPRYCPAVSKSNNRLLHRPAAINLHSHYFPRYL